MGGEMSKFLYYNNNDMGIEEEDCVTRAITLATGLPYKTISKLLDLVGEHNNCERLYVGCYRYLLEDIFNYPVKYPKRHETVGNIIDKYPHNTLLIRIDQHLLCAVAGVIYDLWDSSYRDDVTCYWIVK